MQGCIEGSGFGSRVAKPTLKVYVSALACRIPGLELSYRSAYQFALVWGSLGTR